MAEPIPPRGNASHVPTNEAYARWASTYDSDGNALQALDDAALRTLLPPFLALLSPRSPQPSSTDDVSLTAPAAISAQSPPLIVDLGCGTGRATAKLLSVPGAHILGLDAAPAMLARAREKCGNALAQQQQGNTPGERGAASVQFAEFDMLAPGALQRLIRGAMTTTTTMTKTTTTTAEGKGLSEGEGVDDDVQAWAGLVGTADAVISTLVLEHVPLATFFDTASLLVAPGGYVLVTNMHPDMGARSQAGFTDAATGQKVRPVSYAHGVEDVIRAAAEAGLGLVEVDGEKVREREIGERDVGELGERARKWVGVRCWFGVVFRKFEGGVGDGE